MAGIYVHIPFCSQFCTYCNFYSVKGKGLKEKYIHALLAEIEERRDFFKNTGVSPRTIYFGGGTPSVFSPLQLERVLQRIIQVYNVEPVEVSIEVNPNDITQEYANALRGAGFNRVSMGVQSFVDEHLKWMNRRHKGDEAVQAFRNLRNAGFGNISLDLIFGYAGLTSQLWEYNISRMVELQPEHISAYQMSIEPGSLLGKKYEKGEYDLPPDNLCRAQYNFLQEFLAANGYEQYEISNFARRDSRGRLLKSLHNSSYWTKEPYLGLGPAAHSFNGKVRSWNNHNLTNYCRYYAMGRISGSLEGDNVFRQNIEAERAKEREELRRKVCGSEVLQERDIFNESVMLGLRTVDGVDLGTLDPYLLREVRSELEHHLQAGNLVQEGGRIRIPSGKLFVSDGIIRDLFV